MTIFGGCGPAHPKEVHPSNLWSGLGCMFALLPSPASRGAFSFRKPQAYFCATLVSSGSGPFCCSMKPLDVGSQFPDHQGTPLLSFILFQTQCLIPLTRLSASAGKSACGSPERPVEKCGRGPRIRHPLTNTSAPLYEDEWRQLRFMPLCYVCHGNELQDH